MSDQERDGLYVYQPFGSVTHPERGKSGRLYGVGGLPIEAKAEGFTKAEAQRIVSALTAEATACVWVTRPTIGHIPSCTREPTLAHHFDFKFCPYCGRPLSPEPREA